MRGKARDEETYIERDKEDVDNIRYDLTALREAQEEVNNGED